MKLSGVKENIGLIPQFEYLMMEQNKIWIDSKIYHGIDLIIFHYKPSFFKISKQQNIILFHYILPIQTICHYEKKCILQYSQTFYYGISISISWQLVSNSVITATNVLVSQLVSQLHYSQFLIALYKSILVMYYTLFQSIAYS